MKKKIFAILLCICMVAIAIAGGTMAYFTDTHAVENTFTAGNVDIELTEAVVEKDNVPTSATYGDLLAKADGSRTSENQDYGKLYPAQEICKDPTIENVGSEKAYAAAKVTVTSEGDLHAILGAESYDVLALNEIISGGIEDETFTQEYVNGLFCNNCASYYLYQDASPENNTYVLYFFIKEPLASGDSVTLFEKISIPSKWDNEEMENLKDLSITVEAYATQEHSFKDCFTAMTTAFPSAFPFAPAS